MEMGMLVASAAMLALHGLHLATGSRKVLARLLASLRARGGLFCRGGGEEEEEGKLAEEVRTRMRAWQLEQVRIIVAVVAFIYLLQVLSSVLGALRILPFAGRGLTAVEFSLVLLGYFEVLVVLLCKHALTARTLNLWSALLLLPPLGSRLFVVCPGFECAASQVPMRLCLCPLLISRMDGRYSLLAGLLWLLCPLFTSGSLPEMMEMDAMLVASVVGLSLGMRLRTRQQLVAEVQAELLHERQQAFRALLKNFYDVVLELDQELKVVGPSPELAAFLLHGAGCSLAGRELLTLLREEDRERVEQRLRLPEESRGGGGGGIAEVVHARMRSSGDAYVEVELFCFGFESSLARRGACFVVGIREFSDETQGGLREDTAPAAPPVASPALLEVVEREIAVTVDAGDPSLPVLGASAGFQLLAGGAEVGQQLREQVCNGRRFSGWVQAAVNRELATLEPEREGRRVTFRTGARALATCHCCLGEAAEGGKMPARLVFSGVERRRSRSSGSSGSGRRGALARGAASGHRPAEIAVMRL